MIELNQPKKVEQSFNYLLPKIKKREYSSLNNFIQLPKNNIPLVIIDDIKKAINKIPDKSISVIVTSPPYWNLKDYYIENQLGSEKNPKEYVDKMVKICNSFLRILKDDGAFFFNIGDSYVEKNLQLIPQKIAIKMQESGWLIRNQIIWHKPNHMPSSVKSRFSNSYETIYFFSKNDWEKKINFNLDEIRIPHKSNTKEQFTKNNYNGKFSGEEKNIGQSPGARISVSNVKYIIKREIEVSQIEIVKYLKKYLIKKNYNILGLAKILGYDNYKHKVGHWFRLDAGFSYPSRRDWILLKKILQFDDRYDKQMTTEYKKQNSVKNHPKGKNPSDLFISNTAKTPEKHFAVFPESIPELAIKSCCPENGIVLDPFAGSGTTGIVAKKYNRKSILIDIQKDFVEIMKKRIGNITLC